LPRYPRVVGVVTALTGAAVHDILTVLRARWPTARVIVSPVRVQGKGAGLDIVAALAALNRVSAVEVIIVGRGGGSIEDLWAFNEERVARAIAASRVPVVSAVGHEIDVTVADLVADRRAPTPTAAAQLVVPEREALRDGLGGLATALERGMARRLRQERERAAGLGARLRDPRRVLQMQRQRIDELGERAAAATAQRVRWAAQRLQATGARLHALSPLAVLDRGYSIVAKGDGTIVRAASAVDPGESLAVRLAAGRLQVRVEDRRE
jgi:exodeoxyribonuclease VII large subunit